eukprot:EG_transcript_37042
MADAADAVRILVRPQARARALPTPDDEPEPEPELEAEAEEAPPDLSSPLQGLTLGPPDAAALGPERDAEPPMEVRRILSRPQKGGAGADGDGSNIAPEVKTLEEREEEYAKARERIFNAANEYPSPTTSVPTFSKPGPKPQASTGPAQNRASRRGELSPDEVHEYTR